MSAARPWVALRVGAALMVAGCGATLDAGHDNYGPIPVDARNPVILDNDGWSDNWTGEYTVLLANSGGPPLAGIIAGPTQYWPDGNAVANGWRNLVTAARDSGLRNIPDVTQTARTPLVRPANGDIEMTAGEDTAAARLIVERSRELSLPWRPLVVLANVPLTDLANAYLLDRSVVDRVVVVSILGQYSAPNAATNGPNGDLDPWAGWIVVQRFRYIQVCAYYDQTGDVADADIASLPKNPLGTFMAAKQPDLFTIPTASDQITSLSVGLPGFVVEAVRMSPDTSAGFDGNQGPPLRPDPAGNAWVVTQIAAPLAAARLWQMLLDPKTFGR